MLIHCVWIVNYCQPLKCWNFSLSCNFFGGLNVNFMMWQHCSRRKGRPEILTQSSSIWWPGNETQQSTIFPQNLFPYKYGLVWFCHLSKVSKKDIFGFVCHKLGCRCPDFLSKISDFCCQKKFKLEWELSRGLQKTIMRCHVYKLWNAASSPSLTQAPPPLHLRHQSQNALQLLGGSFKLILNVWLETE